ncbi:hypothetical protein WS99_05085 [Burkholderia territorii]|nr:hypothetical protein WS99_05085 [Burkholderia territorii]
MHRARNENGRQQGSEARRSFDTVQIAMEDEIDFGASRPSHDADCFICGIFCSANATVAS